MVLLLGSGVPAATVQAQVSDDGTAYDFIVPVTHLTSAPAGYTVIKTAEDWDSIRDNLSGKYI